MNISHHLKILALWASFAPISGWTQSADEEPDSAPPEITPPEVFTLNCHVCHALDQAVVGPSLVEIAELYPPAHLDDFINWCVDPGKKRDHLPQMPAMAHVSQDDLRAIHDYIRRVSIGVRRVKVSPTDPFAATTAATHRPRVERTFVPDSGPASVVVALPTEPKFNVIWDTDQCRLRYISRGEVDRWPYLRSNGNALANVGKICYVEAGAVFPSESRQFDGYHLSAAGYPTFVYWVGETRVREKIHVEGNQIVRTINAHPALPPLQLPESSGETLSVLSETTGSTLIIRYRPL